MAAAYAIGIDLGTTNSVVSVYRKGTPETLTVDAAKTVPSVVSFRNGDILVGRQAKSRLLAYPEESVGSVKRSMGNSAKTYTLGGQKYSPVNISSLILKKLMEAASTTLTMPLTDAVITVPAYFNEAQKLDTRKAGEEAGINVLRLIPEPTAAAIAYGLDQGKDQIILVYDLGGGTFDVSVLKVLENTFKVLAVDGDADLGGDDFDHILANHLAAKFKQMSDIDLKLPEKGFLGLFKKGIPKNKLIALQRLKEVAEEAKKELSISKSTEILIPDLMEGQPLEAEITQAQYIEMTDHLLLRTVQRLRDALKGARLTAEDVDRVILVGGATRHPALRDLISREVKEPYQSEQVDEIVAHGAAIMAANLYLPTGDSDRAPITVTNVTAHSLGVGMLNVRGDFVFRPILQKNSEYPGRKAVLGQTAERYQDRVMLPVFRGENEDPEKNTHLGELLLPISNPSETMIPVAAVFELDDDGILLFTAIEIPPNEHTMPFLEKVFDDDERGLVRDIDTLEKLVQRGFANSVNIKIVGATS